MPDRYTNEAARAQGPDVDDCDTCHDLTCESEDHHDPARRERARDLLRQHRRDQHSEADPPGFDPATDGP